MTLVRPEVARILRYGLVGLISNAAGFGIYLALTAVGVWPLLSMTLVYASAASLSFLANRNLTFQHSGRVVSAATRFAVVSATGYLIQAALLIVGYTMLGIPHQIVQLVAIGIVAVFLYLAMRLVVFPNANPAPQPGSGPEPSSAQRPDGTARRLLNR